MSPTATTPTMVVTMPMPSNMLKIVPTLPTVAMTMALILVTSQRLQGLALLPAPYLRMHTCFHPVSPTQDIYGSSIAIWMAASWRNLYQGEKGGTSIDTHPFLLTYPTQFANQTRPRRVDDRTIKCETQRVKEEPKNGNEEEDPTAHSKSKSNKETPRPTAPPTLPTVTRKFHGGNRSSNIATAR